MHAITLAAGFARVFFVISATGTLDVNDPRQQLDKLKTDAEANRVSQRKALIAARLNAAHLNSFENLPVFGMAILSCLAAGVPGAVVAPLCLDYLLLRAAYVVVYAAGLGSARTLLFASGMGVVAMLFGKAVLALQAAGK